MLFIVFFIRFPYSSIIFLITLLYKARGGRGWELLFWFSINTLNSRGRESSLEAVRKGVAFAPVAAVVVVLVGATQLTRVLLLPLAALYRLIGLLFLFPPIFWSALKNRTYFATNANLVTITAYLIALFIRSITLPMVYMRIRGGAKIIGLSRYFSLVRYFCSFTTQQSVLNAVYIPP